jgi:hypothetical protein
MNQDIKNLLMCYGFLPIMTAILILDNAKFTKGVAGFVVFLFIIILIKRID